MNDLQVFSNPEIGQVRSMMIEDAPWFVGKDVALALEYADTAKAIRVHVDAEDKGVDKIATPGGVQNTTIINESGLYSLILSSKLPSAKRFKRWVTSEVLPALRRTGRYEVEGAKATPETELPERTLTHDDYLRAASIVASCRNERFGTCTPCGNKLIVTINQISRPFKVERHGMIRVDSPVVELCKKLLQFIVDAV